jgi:hypothetical protein
MITTRQESCVAVPSIAWGWIAVVAQEATIKEV